jgi:hypothetical protein
MTPLRAGGVTDTAAVAIADVTRQYLIRGSSTV